MDAAMRLWELANNVRLVDPKRDALYDYDADAQKAALAARPWARDARHFTNVRISAVALIKMTMHARSGGDLEVMGLMQGYTADDTFIVTDAFRLPVEGTETRVNAQGDANEYLVEYLDLCRAQGRQENVVGWYHSHPGYGCWLSGIDVDTQALQQQFQDPFLAVVIDPHRTVSAAKVEIGAFRTYPQSSDQAPQQQHHGGSSSSNHQAATTTSTTTTTTTADGGQTVPLAKAAEFGAHANRYYSLDVSHFKSTLDAHLLELLWHKYWVQTLGQSPLLTNRDFGSKQMLDLASKIRQASTTVFRDRTTVLSSGPQWGVSPALVGVGRGAPAAGGSRFGGLGGGGGGGGDGNSKSNSNGGGGGRTVSVGYGGGKTSDRMDKLAAQVNLLVAKERTGLMTNDIKARLFNGLGAPKT